MTQLNRSNLRIVTHFEMSTCCGVILSVAVLQAERRIFRLPALCYLRSLGPLVKTRPFGMTPSNGYELQTEGLSLGYSLGCALTLACTLGVVLPRVFAVWAVLVAFAWVFVGVLVGISFLCGGVFATTVFCATFFRLKSLTIRAT